MEFKKNLFRMSSVGFGLQFGPEDEQGCLKCTRAKSLTNLYTGEPEPLSSTAEFQRINFRF